MNPAWRLNKHRALTAIKPCKDATGCRNTPFNWTKNNNSAIFWIQVLFLLVKLKEMRIFEIIVVYGSYPAIFDAIKNLQKCRWRHKSHILSVTRPFMDLILKNNRPQFRIIPRRVQQKSNEWFPSIFFLKMHVKFCRRLNSENI